eukprot:scaffold1102_cov256-Pinguiococcus_pyrenoidosus.AAC.41
MGLGGVVAEEAGGATVEVQRVEARDEVGVANAEHFHHRPHGCERRREDAHHRHVLHGRIKRHVPLEAAFRIRRGHRHGAADDVGKSQQGRLDGTGVGVVGDLASDLDASGASRGV